jgi:hypothetical protein
MTDLVENEDPADTNRGPNQVAAHQLLSELRTRIATQPLPYQLGVDARALESLWEVFGLARKVMKDNPGCEEFSRITTRMLNVELRPVTAKWHRAHVEGRLNSRDGANDFRVDLETIRRRMREFCGDLHKMAYGVRAVDDETPPVITPALVADLTGDLPFGIPLQNGLIEAAQTTKINESERQAIEQRRGHYDIPKKRVNAVGLGLSGGGIRSSTFCLGVIQVLAEKRLLRDVDFLSTVSGGGYLGSFLTTTIQSDTGEALLASPHGPDTKAILHLRRGAKYLSATNLKGRWALVAATLAGMVLNWTAPLFLFSLLALASTLLPGPIPWRWPVMVMGAISGLLLVAYAFQMRRQPVTLGGALGLSVASTLALLALWLLTYLYYQLVTLGQLTAISTPILSLAALSTVLPVIVRFVPVVRTPTVSRILMRVLLLLAGFLAPIGAIGTVFAIYYVGDQVAHGQLLLIVLTIGCGIVALVLLDINMTAPHRIYRDYLARTFISPNTFGERAAPSTPPRLPLTSINTGGFAPYHLINAVVNLPSSSDTKLRERRSDFYMFSKEWSGAPSLGYHKSDQWESNEGPVDLSTAMAVSGAAASSHMGAASVPSLSALLTLLNVRLGYWIRQPSQRKGTLFPGFICLMREMLGIDMTETSKWINLSDGGHLENMGVYELLRRRCKFIISVDGEADRDSTFHGHLTLVRHAQIDFGIRIEPDLMALRPVALSQFSASHSLMCRVHYPPTSNDPGGVGLILYLKLSMTGDEIELVKRYRSANPDFPHQTTLDQFFDEEQFEAYRQLGVHVAEGLFHPALVGEFTQPKTVAAWFETLAASLLLPETGAAFRGSKSS